MLNNRLERIFVLLRIIGGTLALWAEDALCGRGGKTDGSRQIPVGGQAVIEGVLMKGPEHWGLVVREPDGSLWRSAWLGATWLKRGIWKLYIIRGFASMVEMMKVGMKALSLSAERALGEEESFSLLETVISVGFAIFMVVGLFIALPVWLSDRAALALDSSHAAKNVIEPTSPSIPSERLTALTVPTIRIAASTQ